MASILYYPESFNYRDDQDTLLHEGNDRVEVTESQGADPNRIEFCIGTRNNVDWWKGIILIVEGGQYRTICDVTGKNADQCGLLDKTSLTASNVNGLYLSRAIGFFGVHSNRYMIDNASTAFKNGRKYEFLWMKD